VYVRNEFILGNEYSFATVWQTVTWGVGSRSNFVVITLYHQHRVKEHHSNQKKNISNGTIGAGQTASTKML